MAADPAPVPAGSNVAAGSDLLERRRSDEPPRALPRISSRASPRRRPMKTITHHQRLGPDHLSAPPGRQRRQAPVEHQPEQPAINLFDPQDDYNQEYRAYIGYVNAAGDNVLGLPAHSTITFNVPLVFWDSERTYLATDGQDLIPAAGKQNPFHYDPTSLRGVSLSTDPNSWVQQLTIEGKAATGLVMFYHATTPQGSPSTLPRN